MIQRKKKTLVDSEVCPYTDAVTVPHGDPHGHGDGGDAAADANVVQEGQTETLAVLFSGHTGEAGPAAERQKG